MKYYLIYFSILIIPFNYNCNSDERKFMEVKEEYKQESINPIRKNSDSLLNNFIDRVFNFKDYKVWTFYTRYGKKIYIDSLNYQISRIFYLSDSSKIKNENYEDRLNDTSITKEFYDNGRLKRVSRMANNNCILLKETIYNENGELIKFNDNDEKFKYPLNEALRVARKSGMKKPVELNLSEDSLKWEILVWENIKFDTLTNMGEDRGVGIQVNRVNGNVNKIKRVRNWIQ